MLRITFGVLWVWASLFSARLIWSIFFVRHLVQLSHNSKSGHTFLDQILAELKTKNAVLLHILKFLFFLIFKTNLS